MLKLIEMSDGEKDQNPSKSDFLSPPEIIPAVETPLPDAQTAGLPLDDLCVVEEAVEYLPEQDDGHEDEVDAAEYHDVRLHELGQLLPLIDSFVILSQMPLIVLILCLCLPVTRLRPLPTCKNININWHREK